MHSTEVLAGSNRYGPRQHRRMVTRIEEVIGVDGSYAVFGVILTVLTALLVLALADLVLSVEYLALAAFSFGLGRLTRRVTV